MKLNRSIVYFMGFLLFVGLASPAHSGKNMFKVLDDIEIHGFVSSSYTYNTNRPLSQTNCGNPAFAGQACLRIFDVDDNSFKFDNGELVLLKAAEDKGDIGFRVDLTFGFSLPEVAQRPGSSAVGPVITGNPNNAPGNDDFDVQQGYVTWVVPIGNGLTVDVGKFVTHVGAEVFEGYDGWNMNFSRTFVFGLGIPFTHTGIRTTYDLNDQWSFLFMFANNWEGFGVNDNNTDKTLGVQVGYHPNENIGVLFNWVGGNEVAANAWRNIFDVVVDIALTNQLSLQLNADLGNEEGTDPTGGTAYWFGFAGIVRYDVNKWFSINLRGAHFNDQDGIGSGMINNKLWEITLTPEFRIHENMVVRFEYRHDESNQNSFEDDMGMGTDSQDTFALNTLIHF